MYRAVILLSGLVLSVPANAQTAEELAFIKSVLTAAQAMSIKSNREYCGYIGFDEDGRLRSTKARRGRSHECTPRWPDSLDVVASWHTHAGYDHDSLSEVPSVMDIEADEDEGVDGYVSTPGGRIWYVDTTAMEVSQVCGLGCILSDPTFQKGSEGSIAQSYTYKQLIKREEEGS
ncbi:MAG: DUF4329 domain-containing protein [Pseudomonadota bacterium]